MKSRLASACLIGIIFWMLPTAAWAVPVQWDVASYNNSALGRNANGSFGRNYVMQNPAIIRQHVSSVYVDNWSTPRNAAEVGWFASATQSNYDPRFFAAWVINGDYRERLGGYPTPGTNHRYMVRYLFSGTQWEWRIDGSLFHSGGMSGFQAGLSTASSERDDSLETNYSHFWDLQSRNSVGWYPWTSNAVLIDTDPEYRRNWVSNTEFYVQR